MRRTQRIPLQILLFPLYLLFFGSKSCFVPSNAPQRQSPTALTLVDCEEHVCHSISRRVFHSLTATIVSKSFVAIAAETPGTKPYASLEALLPAARVMRLISMSVLVSTELVEGYDLSSERKQDLVEELEELLLQPHNFIRSPVGDLPRQPAKQYLDSYDEQRRQMTIWQRPGAFLVESGELDTWRRAKRQERERERSDEIRAALNAYTDNVAFNANSYALTASREEKKMLIREDRIPDVKTVIGSDMGIRYLYRNQVLTAMEDARAELRYQMNRDEQVDAKELKSLLNQAQTACVRWFELIDEQDVRMAVAAVEKETFI